jgi:hypothetical protein
MKKRLHVFVETEMIGTRHRTAANHDKAPNSAKVVQQFRLAFGADLKVVHVHEGAFTVGAPPDLSAFNVVNGRDIHIAEKAKKVAVE